MKNQKLSLKKETIARLSNPQMAEIRGGADGAKSKFLCSNTGLRTKCQSISCKGIVCIPIGKKDDKEPPIQF